MLSVVIIPTPRINFASLSELYKNSFFPWDKVNSCNPVSFVCISCIIIDWIYRNHQQWCGLALFRSKSLQFWSHFVNIQLKRLFLRESRVASFSSTHLNAFTTGSLWVLNKENVRYFEGIALLSKRVFNIKSVNVLNRLIFKEATLLWIESFMLLPQQSLAELTTTIKFTIRIIVIR